MLTLVAQLVLATILVILILLQGRGAGLGQSFGGGGELYTTRRGLERILFRLTIIFAALFVAVSFLSLL